MPSPFGHALAGLAIGLIADPARTSTASQDRSFEASTESIRRDWRAALITPCSVTAAIVAASPDLDLLIPNFHRSITHSVGATALVMIVTALVTGLVTGKVSWRWVITLGAAHASHIVMDWLGTDHYFPTGLQALWPFSRNYYISGWDIFPPTERDIVSPAIIAVDLWALVFELVSMGPVVLLAAWIRRRRKSRGQTSGPAFQPRPSS